MGWLSKEIIEKENLKILIDESDTPAINIHETKSVAAGYIRVSTDKQAEEGYGLDVQKDKILNFCRERGIKSCILFIDDGYTGTKMDRPGMNLLKKFIADYSNGSSDIQIDKLIIPNMQRLSRSLRNTLAFVQDYLHENVAKDKAGRSFVYDISFISVDEPNISIDTSNPSSKFMFAIYAALAELDRDSIVNKLRDGRYKRQEQGYWHGGGKTPYGYKYDKETGTLVVVSEEAESIREIFRLYVDEKMSPEGIAKKLGFKGERIVSQILERKSLTGLVEYSVFDKETGLVSKKISKGKHEAIISEETFNKAQLERQLRSKDYGKSQYLLSGLCICGECGSHMRYQKWGRDKCKIVCHANYKSSKDYLKKTDKCDNIKFDSSLIENEVLKAVFSLNYVNNPDNVKAAQIIDYKEKYEKDLQKAKNQLSRLYDLYENETEEDDVLKGKINAKKEEIKSIEEKISSYELLDLRTKRQNNTVQYVKNPKNTWKDLSDTEKQSIIRDLIKSVVLSKNGDVEVHLNEENFIR